MLDKTKVLALVREKGPLLPRSVSRELGGDTFFTGAVLSQLVDTKEIRISYAKIGGSPVYYVIGQEPKLDMLYPYLAGKEKEAYNLLKEKKIIRDITAEPAIRVALRNIRDFAKGLEVNLPEGKEVFWKWHLLPNQEAETLIRQEIGQPSQTKPIEAPKAEPPKVEIPPAETQQAETGEYTERPREPSRDVKEKPKESQERLQESEDHELLARIKKMFSRKEIEILDTKTIRKNSEIEMIILIPSPVGKLKYFCKIKDKKKNNDKDLSSLYIDGQMKKLPVLYVTTGDLTKKAEEMLDSEFKIISVLHI
jgi:hypothetical protein